MAGHHISSRTSSFTPALCALAITGALACFNLAGLNAALADPAESFGGQAEWAQGYDADARLSVQRSTTPVLSPATFDATEKAIESYRQIVQNGGWQKVPTGHTLRLGANGTPPSSHCAAD